MAYTGELRARQHKAFESQKESVREAMDYRTIFMEQMLISKETKKELEQYTKRHKGNLDRIVIALLQQLGILL